MDLCLGYFLVCIQIYGEAWEWPQTALWNQTKYTVWDQAPVLFKQLIYLEMLSGLPADTDSDCDLDRLSKRGSG